MKQCLFLRADAVLPENFGPPGKPIYDGWIGFGSESAHDVDVRIESCGWHFMWLTPIASGIGVGLAPEKATQRGMRSALRHLNSHFNAAELLDVTVTEHGGMFIARVKIASRHIQEHSSMGLVDESVFRYYPKAA